MLEGLSRNIRMYLLAHKYMWKGFLAYRAQAAVWLTTEVASTITSVILITIIYAVSSGINGWSYYQMLTISQLANIAIEIMFYSIVPDPLTNALSSGQFDQDLVKPYNPILTILARYGSVNAASGILSSLAVFVYAAYMANLHLLSIAIIFGVFLVGTAALIMFIVMLSLAAYVLINTGAFIAWIVNIASTAAQYPLTIFGRLGMVLLTVVLPVGLAAFYPSAFVFSKISAASMLAAVLISIAMIVVYYKVSKWLIGKYRSGGG